MSRRAVDKSTSGIKVTENVKDYTADLQYWNILYVKDWRLLQEKCSAKPEKKEIA